MTTTDSLTDHDLRLADGRVLRYQIAGTAHGDAVFLLHGALGSRLVHDFLSAAAAAADAGIRLVSYDRPGNGGSTPHPGRTVAVADDVTAIADQLGLAEALTSADLTRFVEFSSPTLPASDQAILKTEAAAYLLANLREGPRPRGRRAASRTSWP